MTCSKVLFIVTAFILSLWMSSPAFCSRLVWVSVLRPSELVERLETAVSTGVVYREIPLLKDSIFGDDKIAAAIFQETDKNSGLELVTESGSTCLLRNLTNPYDTAKVLVGADDKTAVFCVKGPTDHINNTRPSGQPSKFLIWHRYEVKAD